ncbi:MAG: acriflavine resistance protein B [Methylophaga sp.]|nr:MAG: acriflavine resistance protein B [Methylophaga sp.]
MLNITAFSINNSRFTLFTVLMTVVLGILVFMQYPSKEDPSIVIRQAQVTVSFLGMTPEKIEDLITKPVERKIREIPEVKNIFSDSKTGISLIKIEVHDDVDDLNAVWQELRNKMDDVKRELPSGTVGPIVKDDVGLSALASIALWSDGFSFAEMKDYAEDIQDSLYLLDGTQKIEIYGIQDERIFIELSVNQLTQLGIEPRVIAETLALQNVLSPGGKITANGLDIMLESSGDFQSIDEIASILISVPNTDKLIRLNDIATITRDYVDPPVTPVYFKDKPAIILSVSVLDGINSIEYGEKLIQKVKKIQAELPWGLELDYATYQPTLVKEAVSGAINNLYQTIAIVLFVVIAFLGFRAGLIVGAFVPVTMLAAVVVMRLLDVELQRMSIAAMVISLGMLVDNGIVIAENIGVRIAEGKDKVSAAILAGKSLAIPLLTSTLTTILFFVPIAMAEGGVGEYTLSLAQVITIVLLISWFFSLYLTPMVSAKFLKVALNKKIEQSCSQKIYTSLLNMVLRNRIKFVVMMLVILIGSAYVLGKVDKEFFPLGERNQFLVYVDLPAGSSLNETDKTIQRLAHWLSDNEINPEISSSVSYVASGGPRFFLSLSPPDPDPHHAFTVVNTHSSDQVDTMIERVNTYLLTNFPEARTEVKKMWMGASEAGLFELRIISEDQDILFDQSEKILAALHAIPNMSIAKQDWENKIIKLMANVDQARARAAGVTSDQISKVLDAYFNGTVISDYREGESVIPIVIRGTENARNSLSEISNLQIYSATHSTWIPLIQVVDIEGGWQVGRIKRENQQRTLTITAKHDDLTAAQILDKIQPTLDSVTKHAQIEVGGEIEQQSEANEKLFANFPYAIGLIILLLIWQFNSYRKTAIILLTIPLVVVGATLGLVVMQASFGFMVILGFFSLAGIIINNGIVLIDQIGIEEQKTSDRYQALINACLSRFRPIFITTLTTVLGLMPLILSNDALFYGMASAIAFGLAIGSIMTLVFVPTLYSLFFAIKR